LDIKLDTFTSGKMEQYILLFVLAIVGMVSAIDGDFNIHTVTDEVYFDVMVEDLDGPGQHYQGRVVIGVFANAAPMTALNFVSIARGYTQGKDRLTYKDSEIHRIVPDFVVQMGDITTRDGTGGKSIFGKVFNDEDMLLSHRSAGWVAMANHGPDTNASQFYILLTKARWLDKKHVVFGKVVRGYDVIETLGDVPADENTAVPSHKVKIVDSGVLPMKGRYTLTTDQLDSTEDI